MKKVTCHDIEGNLTEVTADQLRFRPSAYGILIEDGKVLLSKQYDGYDFPGGGVEVDETIEGAVIREFFEETGLKVEVEEPAHIESSFFDPSHSKKHSGEFWNCPLLYFIVRRIGGELTTEHFDEEEKTYADMPEWISIDQIDEAKFINSIDSPSVIRRALVHHIANNR